MITQGTVWHMKKVSLIPELADIISIPEAPFLNFSIKTHRQRITATLILMQPMNI